MQFNWPPLVAGILSLLPSAVIMFIAYGRYDGYFRDNVVFLFFMGGFLLGFALSLLGLSLLVTTGFAYVVGYPLVTQLAKAAALNRRKWQGKRHSVFNGGALGLGIAAVTGLAFTYRLFGVEEQFTLPAAASSLLLIIGLAGVEFATGAYIGSGVADRTPFRTTFSAALAAVPAAYLTLLWFGLVRFPTGAGASLLYSGLAAVYGVIAVAYARHKLMPLGLTADDVRRMRRESRARRT